MRVTKDRHGFVREWANDIVGKLTVAPDGVSLMPPGLKDMLDPESDAMDRVLEFLGENPGASTKAVADGTNLQKARAQEALHNLEFTGRARDDGSDSHHKWYAS